MRAQHGDQRKWRLTRWPVFLVLLMILVVSSYPGQAQTEATDPSPPEVTAQNIVIMNDFNQILYEKGAHVRIPPASLTKMMTAIVALRYGDLDRVVTVAESDLPGEATMGLVAGDQVSIGDLLYGLLLPSGNDAAMAIAHGVGEQMGGTTPENSVELFVGLMNQTAHELQLQDTHFVNPHGLDAEGHYSSAYDLAILLRMALNYPEIRDRMQTYAIRVGGKFDLVNGNKLLQDRDDYLGGKTGLTDGCGFCLVAAVRRNNRMVIAVALRDDWSWFWDMGLLLDYGLDLADKHGVPEWADSRLVGTQLDQSRNQSVSGPSTP